MTWLNRLAQKRDEISQKCSGGALTEPTQPPFGGSVSEQDGHIQKIDTVNVRELLLELAAAADIDEGIVHRLSQDDIDACSAESDATLTTYLQVLVRRKAMGDGVVPEGWTAEVTCRGCGPVLLWPECPPELIACPWCLIRKAGKPLPRPK